MTHLVLDINYLVRPKQLLTLDIALGFSERMVIAAWLWKWWGKSLPTMCHVAWPLLTSLEWDLGREHHGLNLVFCGNGGLRVFSPAEDRAGQVRNSSTKTAVLKVGSEELTGEPAGPEESSLSL